MIPLGSALGQLNWLWLRRVRPVSDSAAIENVLLEVSILLIKRRGGLPLYKKTEKRKKKTNPSLSISQTYDSIILKSNKRKRKEKKEETSKQASGN
jgi:hypothetical protein